MLVSEEFIQYFLLNVFSWLYWESDVYKNACHLAQAIYPEYADIVCIGDIPDEEIKREISLPIFFPDATPPYPGVLLVSGSSPAASDSMQERQDFFVARGFAVMVLDSFTRLRILEDCFKNDRPCQTYQQQFRHSWNETELQLNQCPQVEFFSNNQPSPLNKNYYRRVTYGGTLSPAERAHDFFEALNVFRHHPNIDANNLAVIGYSHGGSVALEALTFSEKQLPPPGDKTFSREEHSLEGIRAVVVYYPNCRPGMYFHWHSQIRDIPLQFHMALNDEYVRPDLCDEVIARIKKRSRSSKLSTLYYDARHAFDMKEYGDAYDEKSKHIAISRSLDFIRETLDWKYQYECLAD